MSEELKPCPFCGGKATVLRDYIESDDETIYEDFSIVYQRGTGERHEHRQ